MVKGLDIFREYFKEFSNSYIIIGGTACDMVIDAAGLTPRATKDIDIILVIEALSTEFAKQFWNFIKDGNYEQREKSTDERKYYRFLKPANAGFPQQVELFSRIPDLLDIDEDAHLTPIPVDDDISNLSAILMDDDYYNYTIEHSIKEDELHRANTEALICLKAKAFLEMTERKANGAEVDSRHIKKHKTDVFRLALLLAAEQSFELPASINADMQAFAEAVKDNLPDKAVFAAMGAGNIEPGKLFDQLLHNFKLNLS